MHTLSKSRHPREGQQCQDHLCSEWVEGQSGSHLLLSVSGSKRHLGDMTVDMPRSLILGKGGVGVRMPEWKENKDGGSLTWELLRQVGRLADMDGQLREVA